MSTSKSATRCTAGVSTGRRRVIVRPEFETAHPVVHGIERRQHQHRRGHALAAQLAAQREPGAVGKADVENDHVEAREDRLLPTRGERRGDRRVDALRAQPVAQQGGELGVVLDD